MSTRPTATPHAPERMEAGTPEAASNDANAHPVPVPYLGPHLDPHLGSHLHPYFGPHLGPHFAPGFTPHPYASYGPPWNSHAATPYHPPYHWTAQPHPYLTAQPSPSTHSYAYGVPAWQPPAAPWEYPTYYNHEVGTHGRAGFTYGFGEGPVGEQMHVGFHIGGRFLTLRFGLYPSATRPFFVSVERGRMNAPRAPAWLHAAAWQTPPAYGHFHGQPASVGAAHAKPWHAVLGIPEDQATAELVTLRYRQKKQRLNSASAGGRAALLELEAAYQSAMQALAARA